MGPIRMPRTPSIAPRFSTRHGPIAWTTSLRLQGAWCGSRCQGQPWYNAYDAALVVGAEAAVTELGTLGLRANRVTVDPARQRRQVDPQHPGEIYRGWPPLALAVARNDTANVQQLAGGGRRCESTAAQGDPLLQSPADAHALPSLQLLLARGANATATDHSGHSALWLAATRNDLGVVKVLLGAGVPPDAHASSEQTPFLEALRGKHPEVAETLLAAGASIEATDAQGHTPLMLACAGGEAALAKILVEHHARIDADDHEHRTALWYAAAAAPPPPPPAPLSAERK